MTKQDKIFIGGAVLLGVVLIASKRKQAPAVNPYLNKALINKIMETISKTNQIYLNGLHPKYRDTFAKFISNVSALGFTPQINSGYRDFKKQEILKSQDHRNASPGLSMHNYGLAIDMQMSKAGKVYGKDTPKDVWLSTGVPQLADKLGLFWGANFAGYSDAVHFEVKGMNTARLQQTAFKQFGTTQPDQIQGNQVLIA